MTNAQMPTAESTVACYSSRVNCNRDLPRVLARYAIGLRLIRRCRFGVPLLARSRGTGVISGFASTLGRVVRVLVGATWNVPRRLGCLARVVCTAHIPAWRWFLPLSCAHGVFPGWTDRQAGRPHAT